MRHDAPRDRGKAERQQHLERPDRHPFGDVAAGLAFQPHQIDAGTRQQAGHGGADEAADGFGGDGDWPRRQQRSGCERQQTVVARGQRAAEQRHHQREVLHEGRAAGDAGVEAPQHDLGDRQQRQQCQREHRQPVLEHPEASALVDAARFGRRRGVERGAHLPRVLRKASRSRVAWS